MLRNNYTLSEMKTGDIKWRGELLNLRAGQLCRNCLGSETSQCGDKFLAVAIQHKHFYFSTKSNVINCVAEL